MADGQAEEIGLAREKVNEITEYYSATETNDGTYSVDGSREYYVERKKPSKEGVILHESIHIKFQKM